MVFLLKINVLIISFTLSRTLSNLYEHANWSHQDLSSEIAEARKNVTKSKLDLLSWENLEEYSSALKQRQKEGLKTAMTDLWGLVIDKAFGNGVMHISLSWLQENEAVKYCADKM